MVAGSIRGMLYEPAVGQENRPSGHSLHSDSPVLFEKLPAKHKYGILVGINIKQTKPYITQITPSTQGGQDVASKPVTLDACPAAHGVQCWLPLL